MSVSVGERQDPGIQSRRIWSRTSQNQVDESTLIGDGPHVHRRRRPHPHPQRMLTAVEYRPRTLVPQSNSRLRKVTLRRNRDLGFYNRVRSGEIGVPAMGFSYRTGRVFGYRTPFGFWPGVHSNADEESSEEEDAEGEEEPLNRNANLFPGPRHWGRTQLQYQQYLAMRPLRRLPAEARLITLKFDLKLIDLKPILGTLVELGLREGLKLAFNGVFHLQL
ncbi:hypothetical protein KR009_009182 [Drosophila setifemur]|nr:hypothetical protein KR009_009182 [Drosophila setifemur]